MGAGVSQAEKQDKLKRLIDAVERRLQEMRDICEEGSENSQMDQQAGAHRMRMALEVTKKGKGHLFAYHAECFYQGKTLGVHKTDHIGKEAAIAALQKWVRSM